MRNTWTQDQREEDMMPRQHTHHTRQEGGHMYKGNTQNRTPIVFCVRTQ